MISGPDKLKKQLIPPYSGKAFISPEARYEAGWAYNAQKKRWVKAAIQDVETSKRHTEVENIALKAEVKAMKATLAQVVPGESEDKGARQHRCCRCISVLI